jgi:hypothetical protein
MEEISEEELKEIFHTFQKDKSPGLDGLIVEFFLWIYEVIGTDILREVEETHNEDNLHVPFNATFITLIPKSDDPSSLDYFLPNLL